MKKLIIKRTLGVILLLLLMPTLVSTLNFIDGGTFLDVFMRTMIIELGLASLVAVVWAIIYFLFE
jgi:hypothetical protein